MGDGTTCKARKNHGRGLLTIHTSISGFQPPSWGEHVPGRKGTSLRFLSLAAPARRPRAYLNLNLLLWLSYISGHFLTLGLRRPIQSL